MGTVPSASGQQPTNHPRADVQIYAMLLFMLCIAMLYACTQGPITFSNGHPYDAQAYFQMANQVALGEPMSTVKPFVFRVALPYLAGKLYPHEILLGFKTLNLVFGVLTLGMLFSLLTAFMRNRLVILFVCLLWIINPHAPFRFVPFFPAFTDSPALFFIVAILFIQQKVESNSLGKLVLLSLLTFVGVLFREIVLVATLSVVCAEMVGSNGVRAAFRQLKISWRTIHGLLPVAAGIIGILVTHRMVLGVGTYTFMATIFEILNHHAKNPQIIVLAFLMAYGPIVALIWADSGKASISTLTRHPELIAYLVLMFILVLIGGYHTDRFWYWTFPAVLPLLGQSVERLIAVNSWRQWVPLMMLCLVAQGLAFRVFGLIPDSVFDAIANPGTPQWWILAPYGDGTNFAQLNASFMGAASSWTVLTEYFIVLTLIYVLGSRLQAPVTREIDLKH
jgi:hypothetical protein